MGDLEDRLSRLGARIADADGPDDAAIAAARERFAARPRRPRRSALLGTLAVAAAIALSIGAWYAARDAPPRRYTVDGAPGETDGWIASRAAPVRLGFDDGTQFVLHPSGRARVAGLAEDGATVRLEGGRLGADVVHRPNARWEVHAGPYVVVVTGTRFEVGWEPEPERLTLRMIEGSVRVSGPLLDPARALEAGQVLTADADEVSVRREGPATAGLPPPPRPEPEAPATDERAGEVSPATEEPPSSRDALWAAADRARYAGRIAEARRALLRLRREHGERGRTSFLLGTLAADEGDHREASRWLETYLREHPRGPLAEASLGRLVELQRSRTVAERYLARYPEGAHASLARALLASD